MAQPHRLSTPNPRPITFTPGPPSISPPHLSDRDIGLVIAEILGIKLFGTWRCARPPAPRELSIPWSID